MQPQPAARRGGSNLTTYVQIGGVVVAVGGGAAGIYYLYKYIKSQGGLTRIIQNIIEGITRPFTGGAAGGDDYTGGKAGSYGDRERIEEIIAAVRNKHTVLSSDHVSKCIDHIASVYGLGGRDAAEKLLGMMNAGTWPPWFYNWFYVCGQPV